MAVMWAAVSGARQLKTQINLVFSKENYHVSRGSLSTNTAKNGKGDIITAASGLFLQGVLCLVVYQLY